MDGVNSLLSSLNNFSFGSGDVGEKKTDETKASDAVSANVPLKPVEITPAGITNDGSAKAAVRTATARKENRFMP